MTKQQARTRISRRIRCGSRTIIVHPGTATSCLGWLHINDLGTRCSFAFDLAAGKKIHAALADAIARMERLP